MPTSRPTVASARLTPSPATRPLLLSPHTTLAWEGTETASIKTPAAQSCRSCLIFFCDSIRRGGAPPLTDGYQTGSAPELPPLQEQPARVYSGLLRRPHVFTPGRSQHDDHMAGERATILMSTLNVARDTPSARPKGWGRHQPEGTPGRRGGVVGDFR
jgi:hypothetical protein